MPGKFKSVFLPKVNRVVKYFIIGDLLLWAGWGFIDPLFSVFVIKNIAGATIASVGYLAAIFWITRCIVQIPISLYLDKVRGEKDDFYALVVGLLITGLAAFSFMTVKTMAQVYFIQFIKAIGFALYIPSWSAIFTRHIDGRHAAFEWAVSSSSVSFGIGVAGFFGGVLASLAGFNVVFLITGLLAILSANVLLFVPNLILPRTSRINPNKIGDHIRAGLK